MYFQGSHFYDKESWFFLSRWVVAPCVHRVQLWFFKFLYLYSAHIEVKPVITSKLPVVISCMRSNYTICSLISYGQKWSLSQVRGIGRKIQGLSHHIIPPPVSAPSATSKTVPAAQVRRGLQKSKSGSGTHQSSPDREKHRMLPPSTTAQTNLWVHLSGKTN